jgi:hypothetical protein
MGQTKSEMEKKSTSRRQSSRKLQSKKRSLRKNGSIVSERSTDLITKETEDTFQAMMDLLSVLPPSLPSASSSSSSSPSSSSASFGASMSSSSGSPPSQPQSSDVYEQNKALESPRSISSRRSRKSSPGGSNYLQISHDGQVRTVLSNSPSSAFVPISQTLNEAVSHYPKNDFVFGYSVHGKSTDGTSKVSSLTKVVPQVEPEKLDRQTASFQSSSEKQFPSKRFPRTKLRVRILSFAFFVAGACLYVTKALWNVRFYSKHKQVPNYVLYSDDDEAWWSYYNNTSSTTISQFDWQTNNRPFLDDDIVFHGQETLPSVSRYQLICLGAAVFFLLAGLLQCLWGTSIADGEMWQKIVFGVMVIAAMFDVASSVLLEINGQMATILYSVSAHLFAVQAMSLIVIHCSDEEGGCFDENDKVSVDSFNKDRSIWVDFAGLSFLVGSLMDVFLSYFQIHETAGISHAYAGLVSAILWLLSSLAYLTVAIRDILSYDDDCSETGRDSASSVLSAGGEGFEARKQIVSSHGVDEEDQHFLGRSRRALSAEGSIGSGSSGSAPFDEVRSL